MDMKKEAFNRVKADLLGALDVRTILPHVQASGLLTSDDYEEITKVNFLLFTNKFICIIMGVYQFIVYCLIPFIN